MVKLNKIYTKTGDDGTTGLSDGSRTGKDSPRMAAIGDVDELNSAIGLAAATLREDDGAAELHADLERIQNDLFDLGADLATPGSDFEPSDMVLRIVPAQARWLEDRIDTINDGLEPLKSFILPGGSRAAASVHLARAIARRAERKTIAAGNAVPLNPAAAVYLNRLSDYLFVLARLLNKRADGEILWRPGASR